MSADTRDLVLCKRCGHPPDWHRHDDEACLSTHPQPCAPAGCGPGAIHPAPFRCLGYDCDGPGFSTGGCWCPDFVEGLTVVVGDVVVSKFGNRWRVEATERRYVVLRNCVPEVPDAKGTVYSGPLPDWAERIERNSCNIWRRPTPQCQCPTYRNAKGPYPSGFCPECKQWYPGVTRPEAIARGDIPQKEREW